MADSSRSHFLVNAWYKKSTWLYLLWPFSLIYRLIAAVRHGCYQSGIFRSWKAPIPVIVVGNITVGGTGKTPLVVAVVKALQMQGLQPAIVSRGYGSKAPSYPYHVRCDTPPEYAGDEPLLLARRTQVPVVIGADRVAAVQSLLEHHACDVIVSDDGLQHYALSRDIELLVVDGQRVFGNGMCLPAGPLREPVKRVRRCDYIVGNGNIKHPIDSTVTTFTMQLMPIGFERLTSGSGQHPIDLSRWNQPKHVHGVAGIGNPERFFNSLRQMGFTVIEHAFDDHHQYQASDLQFADQLPIIMTEKDAVKVAGLQQHIDHDNCWYLPINAVTDKDLFSLLGERTKSLLVR